MPSRPCKGSLGSVVQVQACRSRIREATPYRTK